ncbi:MAG: CBS domain-containing protein [Candidatus Thermoplasmatota archaeon]|nr:CBS domain-containing protein [Candidatus Thermoplasmatota archaeon]
MFLDLDTLVEEIRARRKDLGWSQKRLADNAEVSQSLIAKLERKENVPNYEAVKKIYEVLEEEKEIEFAGDYANDDIISVDIDDTVGEAVELMLKNDFSQIPVKDGDEYVGMVVSRDAVGTKRDKKVKEVMKHSFPILPAKSPKSVVIELLKEKKYRAVMIKDEEKNWKIITPADLL